MVKKRLPDKNNGANLRTTGDGIYGTELIQFIVDDDISVLAPYPVDDFKISGVEALTVS